MGQFNNEQSVGLGRSIPHYLIAREVNVCNF